MILLPRGCSCSTLSVFPKDWNNPKLSQKRIKEIMALRWRIQYRFYDPQIKEGPFAKGRLVINKQMNCYRTIEERRAAVEYYLNDEMNRMQVRGYNHITKVYTAPVEIEYEISPDMPFVDALRAALEKISMEKNTRIDSKSKLKYVEQAAIQLRMENITIKEVRRKHMRAILGRIAVMRKETFTDNTYNSYLSRLSPIFSELLEWEAAETNPISDMKKRAWTPAPKQILTPEECEQIDDFIYKYDPRFHRLIHIFYHSGARTTEIFRVQGKHVNLKKQTVRIFIKKGRSGRWVDKPIQNVVLPFWSEALKGCGVDDYVFSRGLEPGPKPIRPDQVKRRWARHVQGKVSKKEKGSVEKLNITCSWYSLKHLNTERTAEKYGIGLAAAQNDHKSIVVTMGYAVGEKQRIQEQQKKVDVRFTG